MPAAVPCRAVLDLTHFIVGLTHLASAPPPPPGTRLLPQQGRLVLEALGPEVPAGDSARRCHQEDLGHVRGALRPGLQVQGREIPVVPRGRDVRAAPPTVERRGLVRQAGDEPLPVSHAVGLHCCCYLGLAEEASRRPQEAVPELPDGPQRRLRTAAEAGVQAGHAAPLPPPRRRHFRLR